MRARIFKFVFVWAAAFCVGVPPEASAHAVEQIFVEFGQGEGSDWQAEVLFDAAYALPEFRENSDDPPPEREWLVGLPADEHARVRSGADAFLRERLVFRLGEAILAWDTAFPDYESSPPEFPRLLNGGAYIRVRLSGVLPAGVGGEVSLEVTGGPGPNMIVAIGPEGEPRYVTVPPDQRAALLEIEMKEDTGRGTIDVKVDEWMPAVVLAVVLFVAWLLIRLSVRRTKKPGG